MGASPPYLHFTMGASDGTGCSRVHHVLCVRPPPVAPRERRCGMCCKRNTHASCLRCLRGGSWKDGQVLHDQWHKELSLTTCRPDNLSGWRPAGHCLQHSCPAGEQDLQQSVQSPCMYTCLVQLVINLITVRFHSRVHRRSLRVRCSQVHARSINGRFSTTRNMFM
jgi:hypothetical protein